MDKVILASECTYQFTNIVSFEIHLGVTLVVFKAENLINHPIHFLTFIQQILHVKDVKLSERQ